ncbi:MAG: hypothetical protein EU539_01215 [Promethearchaeota archaeon]|nr:MAG: hypothetical protein EU539_01215 [Candidatus Lokiarchaeota archaeon]
MPQCGICGKIATQKCSQCGMPLCNDHIKHGIQFRTNNPVINCPNCEKNIGRLAKRLAIILLIAFIIITISVIFYLNSIFAFL